MEGSAQEISRRRADFNVKELLLRIPHLGNGFVQKRSLIRLPPEIRELEKWQAELLKIGKRVYD